MLSCDSLDLTEPKSHVAKFLHERRQSLNLSFNHSESNHRPSICHFRLKDNHSVAVGRMHLSSPIAFFKFSQYPYFCSRISTGATEPQSSALNGTELISQMSEGYTKTHVIYLYLISGFILAIPGIGFIILYVKSGPSQPRSDPGSESLRSVWSNTSARIRVALLLVCFLNLLVIGSQDAYGDMLLTYAVLGPLSMSKASGTYLTTVYWAAMSFGNLNGEKRNALRISFLPWNRIW